MYSSEGVPITLTISMSCSRALSPGKIGYLVRNYMIMQPADHTSIYVPYDVL